MFRLLGIYNFASVVKLEGARFLQIISFGYMIFIDTTLVLAIAKSTNATVPLQLILTPQVMAH